MWNLPAFSGSSASQEVVEEGRAPGTYVGMEAAHCEDTQPIQHCLGSTWHMCKQTLGKRSEKIMQGKAPLLPILLFNLDSYLVNSGTLYHNSSFTSLHTTCLGAVNYTRLYVGSLELLVYFTCEDTLWASWPYFLFYTWRTANSRTEQHYTLGLGSSPVCSEAM